MQPQSCYIWEGIVVTGCVRGSRRSSSKDGSDINKIVNGLNYVVSHFDDNKVTVRVHPDFIVDSQPTDDELEIVDADHYRTLPWKDFLSSLRLTHALPYVYYQGETVRDKTLMLMNLDSQYFTMRHLILGLGRVTKSEHVKLCPPIKEKEVMSLAMTAYREYEQKTAHLRGRVVVPPEVRALLDDAGSAAGDLECVGDIGDIDEDYETHDDEVVAHEDCFDDSAFGDF